MSLAGGVGPAGSPVDPLASDPPVVSPASPASPAGPLASDPPVVSPASPASPVDPLASGALASGMVGNELSSTVNVSPSTSLTFANASTVTDAPPSVAAAVKAAVTVGPSFAPVTVQVTVWATLPPLPSSIV